MMRGRRGADAMKAEAVGLRAGTAADLRDLHALDQLCYPEEISYTMAEMRYYFARPGALTIIAQREAGELAGFAIAHPIRYGKHRGGHIITIDVASEMRRRGVGSLLMGAVEEQFQGRGVTLLRLEVAIDNFGAQQFYRHLGFATVSRLRGYYQGTLDAFVMEKPLPPPL